MSHKFFRGFPNLFLLVLVLTACASLTSVSPTQLSSSDQVATVVAATLQALPTNTPVAVTSEAPAELLPHALYYLDGQVRRIERDAKTNAELTFEPSGVVGYDVSLVDGTLAFIADNQLLLVNADGSNRRVLVQGDPTKAEHDPRFFKEPLSNPVFSPDGLTIAYAHKGLNLNDVTTGVSKLVLEDQRSEMGFPIEIYSPVSYSPDGTKLLLALGGWESSPKHAVYVPETNTFVRYAEVQGYFCCSDLGGPPVWSPDSSSFYGVASLGELTGFRFGELWNVDAENGAVTRTLPSSFEGAETLHLPIAPYFVPDGQLYFFFGTYTMGSGYYHPPVLNLVRSAPDGVTDRTVLRDDNFVLINGALWAPDASFVIASTQPAPLWDQNQEGGVLELYYTDGQKSAVWLAPFGKQMKWGP